MAHSKNYEELIVWQKSIDLAKGIYSISHGFPKEEIYGLTAQIRRCAVSISSNLAEGCMRSTDKEFSRFIEISAGSNAELHTQLIIAYQVGILLEKDYKLFVEKTREISRMLHGLLASIKV